jgi:hypothetical protein
MNPIPNPPKKVVVIVLLPGASGKIGLLVVSFMGRHSSWYVVVYGGFLK